MSAEMEQFSKFIKDKRTALGWSASDLAEKAFNDRKRKTHISDIETGRKKGITIDTMGAILKAFNTKIRYEEL